MTEIIRAPWTPEEAATLNRFQREGGMHPFTCGGDHWLGTPHLEATPDGWRCPYPDCDYTQDWAHAFMLRPEAWPSSRVVGHATIGVRIEAATEATEEPGIDLGTVPADAWNALIEVAQWVSRGRSAAFIPDDNLGRHYPDAKARRALGTLHEAGLLNLQE